MSVQVNGAPVDYSALALRYGIPDHMIGGLRRYIEHKVGPGDFLMAVLCNDLRRACERADDTNIKLLVNYVRFLYNDAPSQCWGSAEKVKAWLALGDSDHT